MDEITDSIINSTLPYKDVWEQAFAVTRSIAEHAFVDGNKRTAFDTLNMLLDDLKLKSPLNDTQKWDLINKIGTGELKDVSDIAKILKENKANFLIKYDSIRENNKYTVMLFDTVKNERISGGDTNSIIGTEQNIMKDTKSNVDFNEINELFNKVKNSVRMNVDYVAMLSINYTDDSLAYTIYLDESENISHNKFHSYKEIEKFVRENYE